MASYNIVEGTTIPLLFQLLEGGSPINLFGVTVTLLLEDTNGDVVTNPGLVAITDTSTGKVAFTPTNANVFNPANGPYAVRWQLVEPGGRISYVPTGPRDIWHILGK